MESKISMGIVEDRIKSGALAGIFGAWAIFGLIFFIDSVLGFEPGTFYKVIALAFGINTGTVYVGFLMHMITGVVIGMLYGIVSIKMPRTPLAVIAGGVGAGVVAWGVLFMPITNLIVYPSLTEIARIIDEPLLVKIVDEPLFSIGTLSMHLVYGFILGLLHYLGVAKAPRVGGRTEILTA